MLRAARSWGMTPTRFTRLPSADRRAILALQALEDEACPCGCGQPMAECCADDGPEYRVESVTCRARVALDKARDDEDDPEPGVLRWVVADVASDDEAADEAEAERQALAALRAQS